MTAKRLALRFVSAVTAAPSVPGADATPNNVVQPGFAPL
jgi:hypothetical protein